MGVAEESSLLNEKQEIIKNNSYKEITYLRTIFNEYLYKKLILEKKKELEIKVIKKIFWNSKTANVMNLNFSTNFFEESIYNFERKIK